MRWYAVQVLVLAAYSHFVPLVVADPPSLADAPLHAVQFVDDQEGWAVGDEGVIWHTIDGGQTWERQASGTRASLRSLCLLDPFTGYAAGTEILPDGRSAGVILYTSDGGLKWQKASVRELPGIFRIKFLDKRNGYVAGAGSASHPSGIFVTEDGGITWKPLGGAAETDWLAADFAAGQLGVLGGKTGTLVALRPQGLIPAEIDSLGRRGIRAVQLLNRQAWAVGEGGLVLHSSNSVGLKWQYAQVNLPPEVARIWDFHAVHFVGDHGWMVGRPGSVVLHTWDKGKSWQVQQTGQPVPLHGVWFVDERQGWAVGDFGTILATTDGGRTWKVQRRGGQRAAVLMLTGTGEHLPVGTVAVLGGDEGYLVVALRLVAPERPRAGEVEAGFAQAVRQAGGSQGEVLWQFPRPKHLEEATASELARFWGDSMDEARGYEEMIRQIVLALRIWRPDVVVVPHPDPRSAEGQTGAFVALAASKAFELAGKADAFPEQMAKLDLQPWTPSKLYGRWDGVSGAHVVVDPNTPRPQLQMAPAEHAAAAYHLLAGFDADRPSLETFRLLASRLDQAENHKHLMQDLKLGIGGQARRDFTPVDLDLEAWQRVVKVSQQKRDLVALGRQAINDDKKAKQLPALLPKQLADLDDERGGDAAFALGSLYASSGQWLLARETFLLMLDRYPAHRLAPEAARWLIRFGSSSEARRREELKHFVFMGHMPLGQPLDSESVDEEGKPKVPRLRLRGGTALIRRRDELREWAKSSLAVADVLAAMNPRAYQEPDVQLCLQSAHRFLGQVEESRLWLTQFRASSGSGPWHDAAGAELWLMGRVGQPPKPAATCVSTDTPPYLDGHLDDPCWTRSAPIRLNDAVGQTTEQYGTEAWITHDANFLYLALRCRHPGTGHMKDPVKPRPRDAQLDGFDRVSLMLDLDRDYCTWYRLEVDQRGCVREDCWGDRSWNPKWYVAVHAEPTVWQIEAAIPLAELTGNPIEASTAWAFNLVRTIPGKGTQAFSAPRNAEPQPEHMGLLLFQRDLPKEPMPPPRAVQGGTGF
ncbi:MAG: YCF48-related protein [Gemmatales bacterium]|nr:YCF48-related protein [Gemmatales bacterium]MDW8385596.1 YCF48-related protein [Gemmatales bacterium]